jgi:hypothetical protein
MYHLVEPMKRHRLSDVIDQYALKRLTAHEVDPSVSNGHEFQGVNGLRALLGTQRFAEAPCTFIYLPADTDRGQENVEASVSWYDSREKDPGRSAEWRLYYDKKAGQLVQLVASDGDLFALAKLTDGRLIVFLAASGSTNERQLLYLLNEAKAVGPHFEIGTPQREIGFVEESILAALGIQSPESEDDAATVVAEEIFRNCSGSFPTTADFSERARASFLGPNVQDDPDAFLTGIMEWETALFRLFEEKLIALRLEQGFRISAERYDVAGFISFARSIGNRRFARAGFAFEHHVKAVLLANKVPFEWHAQTEGKRTPDFLFPSGQDYRNRDFPANQLRMLATKTTCKDRWRQVINEAARIEVKHLLTLEPAISHDQTSEMQEEQVQLVIPRGIQPSYTESQRKWIMSFSDFLDEIKTLM